jgi:hypothetical protein
MDLLKDYFIQHLESSVSLVGLFEFGAGWKRFDLMILNASKQIFRGFEFKRTRADFLRDIRSAKWIDYLNYCNTFTWVCPAGLIHPEEIISPAGLLWIGDKETSECYDGTYTWIKSQWKKMPKGMEISQETFNRIICLFVQRVKFRKDDFY